MKGDLFDNRTGRGPSPHRLSARRRERTGGQPEGLEAAVLDALRAQTRRWGSPARGISTGAIASEVGLSHLQVIEALRGLSRKGHAEPWSRINGSRAWRPR